LSSFRSVGLVVPRFRHLPDGVVIVFIVIVFRVVVAIVVVVTLMVRLSLLSFPVFVI